MHCATLGMISLLALAGTALAQSPPGPDAAASALSRARAFIASSSCPTATAHPAAPPESFSDPTVREASFHRILIEGCGHRIQRNYLVIVLADGTRRMVETLPGTTVTDPILQRDALRAATMAARHAASNCPQVSPRGTDFVGPDSEPNAPRRTRPWSETWTFEACGALLGVPMQFVPTNGGTNFTAGSPVRRLN